ncbi:MAG TPA: GvpL/GvpF family gas vesicle protein [Pyrinomonadaceae bacterium]|nr:GvpL/GvpF family gas vesicle protein [Pyrinomonadaceae bacterium]
MKVYAYCLCADLETLAPPASGVSGAAVRILQIENILAVVTDCETVSATRENMLAHAAVVRSVFEQTTTVPFRFGTLVNEQQLRSFVTGHKVAIANKLEHLRGCVEMDLKINWQRSGLGTGQPDQKEQPTGPGTAFLREKRRELLGDEHTAAQRKELSVILREELDGLIKDEEMNLKLSETAVLGKVFHLIESANISQYQDRISEVSRTRLELGLTISGPWPPYSFANIELELERSSE